MTTSSYLKRLRDRLAWKAESMRALVQIRTARDRIPGVAERRAFAPVLDAWRPEGQPPTLIVRWQITEWCNYSCPYCIQSHDRRADKGGGKTAHAFDNFPLERWIDAFERHFSDKRLSIVITGGEPFVDRAAIRRLLTWLSACDNVAAIRIDTNAWWRASDYADLDKSKITLMCTLHPSGTSSEKFASRIDALLENGFRIGIVNYVMSGSNIEAFVEYHELLRSRGVVLHPNPLWDSEGKYSEEDRALMKRYLPPLDYGYRSGEASPCGKQCLEPTLAYELDYTGKISVACFQHEDTSSDFFASSIPRLFTSPVRCPHRKCVALDQYSFLRHINRNVGIDPLAIYGDVMRAHEPGGIG